MIMNAQAREVREAVRRGCNERVRRRSRINPKLAPSALLSNRAGRQPLTMPVGRGVGTVPKCS